MKTNASNRFTLFTRKNITKLQATFLLTVANSLVSAQSVTNEKFAATDSAASPNAAARSHAGYDPSLTMSRDFLADQLVNLEQAVPLRYNKTVHTLITSYATRRRTHVQKMLERQGLYFPIFEATLSKYGLPTELKYLSVMESALNPRAVSPARAAGLWQFMPSVGRAYGLQQDAYLDERLDAEKATIAACCYLKVLYTMFGDWELALAAYNAGPGRVRRAIRKAGNKTSYAAIAPFLPAETRAYVPTFVAITFVMNYHKAYTIYPDSVASALSFDTIRVNQPVDIALLAKQLNVPVKEMQGLNPAFKRHLVPAWVKNYTLRIPKRAMERLNTRRYARLASATPRLTATQRKTLVASTISAAMRQQANLLETFAWKKKVTHRMQRTQTLADLAATYQVAVADIRTWNYLENTSVQAGQKLVVFVDKPGVKPFDIWLASAAAKIETLPSRNLVLVQPSPEASKSITLHSYIVPELAAI